MNKTIDLLNALTTLRKIVPHMDLQTAHAFILIGMKNDKGNFAKISKVAESLGLSSSRVTKIIRALTQGGRNKKPGSGLAVLIHTPGDKKPTRAALILEGRELWRQLKQAL